MGTRLYRSDGLRAMACPQPLFVCRCHARPSLSACLAGRGPLLLHGSPLLFLPERPRRKVEFPAAGALYVIIGLSVFLRGAITTQSALCYLFLDEIPSMFSEPILGYVAAV